MIRNNCQKNCIYAALAMVAILLTASAAWAEKPAEASSPAKPVVVKNTDPIPVKGDVNATIQGTVPVLVENQDPIPVMGDVNAIVSGIVEVENFDAQLNDLKSEVRQVNDEVQRVREAVEDLREPSFRIGSNYIWKVDTGPESKTWPGADWPGTLYNIELIVLSSNNDSLTLTLRGWDRDNERFFDFFKVGEPGSKLPSVLSVNLPAHVEIRDMRLECWNKTENCEATVSLIAPWQGSR